MYQRDFNGRCGGYERRYADDGMFFSPRREYGFPVENYADIGRSCYWSPCRCRRSLPGPLVPRGFPGPVRPQNPAGLIGPAATGLAAYGSLYNITPQTLELVPGEARQISIPAAMPAFEAAYSPVNSITIIRAGVYEIDYSCSFSALTSTTLTVAVRKNGIEIPETVLVRAANAGVPLSFSGSVFIALTAGEVIDMAVSSLSAVRLAGESGVSARLMVKKLNG